MSWRAIIPGVLALVLLAAPGVIRSSFAQTDDDPVPSAVDTEPSYTPLAAPMVSSISAAKPKRRVTARRPVNHNAGGTPVNFFGEFNLLRLFGIAAIPRSTVAFSGSYKPGTVVIHTKERRLYLVLGNGEALRYGIGVGREGFTWRGVNTISDKREWPSWTPPPPSPLGAWLQPPDPPARPTILGEDHRGALRRRDLLGGLLHEYRRAA